MLDFSKTQNSRRLCIIKRFGKVSPKTSSSELIGGGKIQLTVVMVGTLVLINVPWYKTVCNIS